MAWFYPHYNGRAAYPSVILVKSGFVWKRPYRKPIKFSSESSFTVRPYGIKGMKLAHKMEVESNFPLVRKCVAMCSLHQPRSSMWRCLEDLLVMAPGPGNHGNSRGLYTYLGAYKWGRLKLAIQIQMQQITQTPSLERSTNQERNLVHEAYPLSFKILTVPKLPCFRLVSYTRCLGVKLT